MLANSTLGGFSNNGPSVRLGGITFAGSIADALANITPRESLRLTQKSLNDLPSSLPKLVEDGIMGPKTIERIKEFQRQNGLLETGVLTDPTVNLLAAKSFAARNAHVRPTEIYTSGQQDNDMRKIMKITYDAIKDTCDCKLSLDGLKIIWPEKPQGVGATWGDAFADWLPGGKKANALIEDILGATKDVAKAGAQGFGAGFGATLPYAPLVYVGGAVVGIIILKKFF